MQLHSRRWQTKNGLWPLLIPCSHRPGSWESVCLFFPNGLEGLLEGGLWVPGELSQLREVVPGSPCRERPLGLRQVFAVVRVSFPVNKGLWGPRTIKVLPCSQSCLRWPEQWRAPVQVPSYPREPQCLRLLCKQDNSHPLNNYIYRPPLSSTSFTQPWTDKK